MHTWTLRSWLLALACLAPALPSWAAEDQTATSVAAQQAALDARLADPAQSLNQTLIQLANLHPTPAAQLQTIRVLLQRRDLSAHLAGLRAAAGLGRLAHPLAGLLESLLDDASAPALERLQTLDALVAIGPPLADDRVTVRRDLSDAGLPAHARAQAARLLGWWPDPDGVSVHLLEAAAELDDCELAATAFGVLGRMHQPPVPESYGEWLNLGIVQQASLVEHLVMKLPPSPQALDQSLLVASQATSVGARLGAVSALGRAAPGDPRVISLLLACAVSADPQYRRLASASLVGDAAEGFPGLPSAPAAIAAVVERLGTLSPEARTLCEQALCRCGAAAAPASDVVLQQALRHPDLPLEDFAVTTRLLQAIHILTPSQRDLITSWLDPSCPLYHDRSHLEVEQLQALTLVLLSRVGVTISAHRWILGALSSPDGVRPLAFAAAARAAASEGPAAHYAVAALAVALAPGFVDAAIDLDEPRSVLQRVHTSRGDPSRLQSEDMSARVEAIRALAAIGPGSVSVLPALRQLRDQGDAWAGNSHRLRREAAAAIVVITVTPH